MKQLAVSIVIYKHKLEQLSSLLEVLNQTEQVAKVWIIDNSPQRSIEFERLSNVHYAFTGLNLGYGKGHNLAIRQSMEEFQYHLVLNPDIQFETHALTELINYMNAQPNIALLMPRVLYPDGATQYLCKLLPTPFDLIVRRFIPKYLQATLKERLDSYELKHKSYSQTMEVPNLSGCFMLMRCDALKYTGLFDERFFMYLEDTDLCRRINAQFKTVYYPEVSIIHNYEKGSYKSLKLLFYHISSAIKYFNKYGWFFDSVRTTINKLAVK